MTEESSEQAYGLATESQSAAFSFSMTSFSLVGVVALMIFSVLIILYAIMMALYQPQALLSLFTTLLQSQLVGVIIGGILTLMSSYFLFSLKNLRGLQNIARGFISELETYRAWDEDINMTYSALDPNTISTDFLNYLNRPIFTDESLFYTFRKEMFSFDASLVNKMLQFYSYLKAAEEDRRRARYYAVEQNLLVENFDIIIESVRHLVESVEKADALIPEIIRELEMIVNRKI